MKKKFIIFFIVLASFLLTASAVRAGLGVSPAEIIAPYLFQGAHYEKEIILSRSNPDESLDFRLSVEGPAKEWISFAGGLEFTAPAGIQRIPLTVIIDVPEDAALDVYEGKIRANSVLENESGQGGSGVGIKLGTVVGVRLTVTDEKVLEYKILSASIEDIEEGSLLSLIVRIENVGNVEAKPTRVHLDIWDRFQKEIVESVDVTDIESIEPFKIGDIKLSVPTKLTQEYYWADIKIYQEENLLYEDSEPFKVLKPGTLYQGRLKSLQGVEEIELGEKVLSTGVFENVGERSIPEAYLIIDVYQNGALVDSLKSEAQEVGLNRSENFVASFTPARPGQYKIKGHITYANQNTETKEITFKVVENQVDQSVSPVSLCIPILPLLVFVLVLIIALVLWKIIKLKKSRTARPKKSKKLKTTRTKKPKTTKSRKQKTSRVRKAKIVKSRNQKK